eukprot:TRINITY_DN38028_c0_g1_i1.p1 TRINITY_DN38028_c0_g1~~TRINITY_DN38028_c0_g1_i1.p1  ORF type:complete len:178 (-),score=20.53 TRINITY_DN38028_c0_g1_i1:10-543(-)
MPLSALRTSDADRALESILEGFIENHPTGVGILQRIRNLIVRPLGLRTAPIACGVSSLLGRGRGKASFFGGKFPVIDVVRDGAHRVAVVLGADDKHLRFRTVVGVDMEKEPPMVIMTTLVDPFGMFGHFYATVVDPVHRRFVTPEILRHAAAFSTAQFEHEGEAWVLEGEGSENIRE